MSSLALFDEPPRVSISEPDAAGGSRVALLLGFVAGPAGLEGLLCLEDGSLTVLPASVFTVDYRYRVETDRWIDMNSDQPDREG